MKPIINENYKSKLSLYDTQAAISLIKKTFETNLSTALNLKRVSAPLFVEANSGLNDDLDGKVSPVSFTLGSLDKTCVVVHSLAKWKRMALYRYGFFVGNGLYTDMNAIRKDEKLDNLHSIYVDQWDWEKVINKEDRNLDFLFHTVKSIHQAILATLETVKIKYSQIDLTLNKDLYFISSQQLLDKYPNLSSKEREYEITKEYGSVFIYQIGGKLSNGTIHDDRASDYDDWNLNGDLLYFSDVLNTAIEISSMGIRVDEKSLNKQLEERNEQYKSKYQYHQMILNKQLPLTIGGGIGESRLCMLLMQKMHIGEVQSSIWDDVTYDDCDSANITIL